VSDVEDSELTSINIILNYADIASEKSLKTLASRNIVNMGQDVVSDALNKMMNAKRARKTSVVVTRHSKLLLSILAIAKIKGYVKSYKVDGNSVTIELGNINGCQAIKPRFIVKVDGIEKYEKRYLPAKDLGILIVSTNQGLMTNQTAQEKNLGGSLIAYIY
jgi:small subunit ribosomal protein S8